MRQWMITAGILCLMARPAAAQYDTIEVWGFDAKYLQLLAGTTYVLFEADNVENEVTGPRIGLAGGWGVNARDYFIASFEAEVGYSHTNNCASASYAPDEQRCIRTGLDVTAGAKLGVDFGNLFVPYIKAGFTSASIKSTWDNPIEEFRENSTSAEFSRLGLGVDINIGRSPSTVDGAPVVPLSFVTLEYRIGTYGRLDSSGTQFVVGYGRRFP